MKYRLLPLLPLAIVLLNSWFLHSWIIGLGAVVIYTILFLTKSALSLGRSINGALILLGYLILTNATIYYIYGTTQLTSFFVLLGSYIFFLLPEQTSAFQKTKKWIETWRTFVEDIRHPFRDADVVFLSILVAFLDTTLLGLLWARRTMDVMPSPWQAVTVWFFIVFTLSTLLLFSVVSKQRHRGLGLTLISLHLFTMYSIVAILYPLGYGFDAFIHRATESWIFEHGSILPKEPYYIGQYSLVVFLSHITGLSIHMIDIFLVPFLAASLLPAVVASSLARIWKLSTNWQTLLVLGICFIPFLSGYLTTPHNLVLLLSIVVVFTTMAYQKDTRFWYIPFILTLAAIITHPLIGAPILGFFLTAVLIQKASSRIWKIIWLSFGSIGQLFLLPMLFTVNNVRTGNGLPIGTNPFTAIPHFLELFARPYWYLKQAPLFWEMIYTWERMIVPVAILFAVIGFVMYKQKTIAQYLYPLTALAMFLSAWLLRSWITFPNVVIYEQGDYPLRLIRASILFLLPWMLYGIYQSIKSMPRPVYKKTLLILFACLLTMSLYFSYPQKNIKSRFPGFNVTADDMSAVEWIHTQQGTQDKYIVLANQLVSAAALTKYSFAKSFDTTGGEIFYYSIPTGGPLYQQYGKMLYEGQKREFMLAAMDLVHVDTSYFVVNRYWANADNIIEGAKETANSWQEINDGKVWIFQYHR